MDREQEKFFEKVQRTLRLADLATECEAEVETRTRSDMPHPTPFAEIPFAIGMGILAILTAIISVGSATFANKLMFGCFSAICLLVCVYKLDKMTQTLHGKIQRREH